MPGPRPRTTSPGTPTPRPARKTPAAATTPPRATGVDYITLLGEQHDRQTARPVNYRALMPAAGHGGAPACEQQEQQGRDGHGAGEEDGRG
jgi:hypothetical protein